MFTPNFPFELLYSASYSTFFSTKYLVLMNSTITMVPIKYVKINWIILELRGQDCKVQNFWEVHIFFQKSRNSFWTRRVSSIKVPAFLRGPKKIATSFLWFWHLISKHQNHKENGANFCGLLRKVELYHRSNCFRGFFWKNLKTPKRHFEINWPLAIACTASTPLAGGMHLF